MPSSAGGGTDFYARLLGQALSDVLRQSIIIDNQPGASGNIGAAAAARAVPDGYTLMVSADPALTVNPSLYKNLPYDAERDFEPVARGVVVPLVICVHASMPVRTLAELFALGRREPGTLAFGTAGSGSPSGLLVRIMAEASGAKFLHVPYKGMGQALPAFLSGQVQILIPDVAIILPHIKSGKIVPLAINYRSPLLPATPLIAEAGFPTISFVGTFSVVAPAGTPAPIVLRWNTEINKAMKLPAVAEKLQSNGFVPVFDTPEEFGAHLKKTRQFWADFIRRAGVAPD